MPPIARMVAERLDTSPCSSFGSTSACPGQGWRRNARKRLQAGGFGPRSSSRALPSGHLRVVGRSRALAVALGRAWGAVSHSDPDDGVATARTGRADLLSPRGRRGVCARSDRPRLVALRGADPVGRTPGLLWSLPDADTPTARPSPHGV